MKYQFPKDFLWGAGTSAHQVEGGNWNSDWWEFEHTKGTPIAEPSGDTCDQYHRYPQDIALMADLGLNAYRFGIEWARIEPEDGEFSLAALNHYLDVCRVCREQGIKPVITLNHNSLPRWVARKGGYLWDGLPKVFARYCGKVTEHLKEYLGYVLTLNEPDLTANLGIRHGMFPRLDTVRLKGNKAAERSEKVMLLTHPAARETIKTIAPHAKVGWTLAVPDWGGFDGPEEELMKQPMVRHWEGPFLEATRGDDFVGLNSYTRLYVSKAYNGMIHGGLGLGLMFSGNPKGTRLTQMGWEFAPESLGGAIRRTYQKTGLPILITENGFPGDDDRERVEFINGAMESLKGCMEEGLPVQGYLYWSLLDNFEWNKGFAMHFGLVAVNPKTFERTPKPSAHLLGKIARQIAI